MNINTPTGGDDKVNSIMEQWEQLSDDEKNKLFTILTKDKKENLLKDFLYGDEVLILKYLKKYCVKVKENVRMMGYKGRKIFVKLPAIGNFKGFKFDCFASYKNMYKKDFEKNPKLKDKSFSEEEIQKLLQAMNEFMREFGVKMDEITTRKARRTTCDAGEYLKEITGLYGRFWLKDKHLIGKKSLYSCWDCSPVDIHFGGACYFWENDDNPLDLLLKC